MNIKRIISIIIMFLFFVSFTIVLAADHDVGIGTVRSTANNSTKQASSTSVFDCDCNARTIRFWVSTKVSGYRYNTASPYNLYTFSGIDEGSDFYSSVTSDAVILGTEKFSTVGNIYSMRCNLCNTERSGNWPGSVNN